MRLARNLTAFVVLLAVSAVWSADDDDQPAAAEKPAAKPAGKQALKPAVSSLPVLPGALHDALQAKNFEQAVTLIDAALKREKPPEAAYLLYLKGRAQTELGQLEQAAATFKALEEQDPQGRWISRSRFGRADVLVRQRNYRSAGDIYRAEAERLLSAGRRDELTGIYLEFADRYFEGVPAEDPSKVKKPDFKQSLTYYMEALKLKPSLKLKQKINLRVARCHQELKQFPQAIAAYQRFLKQYAADDTKADVRCPAELEVQARYQLGRSQLAAGQRAEARKTWQDFLASDAAKAAGKDLLPEAAYRLARTYGIPAPGTAGDLELGVAAHEKFLKQYPKHKLAAKAQYEIAQSYIHLGRHEQAVARLQALIANPDYSKSTETAEARRLLGNSYLAQKKFTDAITAWKVFLEEHPTHRSWSAVQRQVVDAEYQMAGEQQRLKNYDAARKLWETFLNKYPLDARAAGILYRFGQMKYVAAVTQHVDRVAGAGPKGSPGSPGFRGFAPGVAPTPATPEGDAVRALFTAAIADWRRLESKYPNTNEASQAGYMIGVTLEDRLGQLADALEAYKKVKGQYQSASRKRIANLTNKQLELITERKFRTNEKPSVKLTTRNLEKVSIKLYRIDMADYFRKMHLAGGIETLDIALIDPDKSWDYEVKDYEQYRRLENEVEIPIDEPGVTAVTVSSEKLEVTTMVVISNIDLVVKSSRNELFVFAEEMLTKKPAEGVSLLISDGKQVFAEEVTNGDGILQKSFKQLKSVNDLRVFAIREGHSASTVSSLNGLNFAIGLSDKGYLFSDRPAYRAGQLVNLKGIVRRVEQDRYTFKADDKYKLDVYDARGRTIHTEEVALNKFGAFADNFMLPETAAQGQYRVHLHQAATKQSYETTFVVREYKLEPLQLVVDLPQDVYFRGETVKGTITLKYYYGTPLAGRTIRYQLAGDRLHTAETNDKGQVEFEFPTRRYSESQVLILLVQYPERNLQTGKSIYLATRGFEVGLSTLRSVYIAGETFDTTLKVTDPSGEPVGTELKVEVLERTRVKGKSGEKLLEEHTVKSDEKTGEVRQTLRIDKAGTYIIRATGTDRFGNPVSGSHAVVISGDEDTVRLRILSDKHHYPVGDTAKVQLHWREEDALALVTYEGASILGYRLMPLKRGANALEIPLESKLAPNFVLSVTVMEGNKFHQAASEFRLTRKLNIALKPDKTTVKPGDELKVAITVTDPQGKPVSAEVSLGLIQKNLLDRFGDAQTVIDEFFGAGYRTRSLRVATSCTFNYRPKTRGISQFLLAEADRQRILADEVAAIREIINEERMARTEAENRLVREELDEVEMAAIPFSGAGQPQDAAEKQQLSRQLHNRPTLVINGIRLENRPGTDVSGLGGFAGGSGQSSGGFSYDLYRKNSNFARGQVAGNGQADGNAVPLFGNVLSSGEGYGQKGDKDWAKWGGNEHFGETLSLVIRQSQSVASQSQMDFYDDISNGKNVIVALNGDGEFQVVNGLSVDELEDMAKEGFQILPKMAIAETGFWDPAVVTDENGKATVTFRVPDRSTAWLLKSKGVDADTLAGQTEVEITAKKDLFGDVKTPLAFVRGDKVQVLVEVHNSTVKQDAKIEVALKITIGERTTELKKTVTSKGPGIEELTFPVEITEGESAKFELSVVSGDSSDSAGTTIPIRPYGMPVFATASGSAAQNTIAFVEHDKALAVEDPSLEIVIGPSLNRTLLDAVLGSGVSPYERSMLLPHSGLERAISDALGGVSLLGMVKKSATADSPEAQALAGRIQSAISQLVSAQRNDGGWSWSGRPQAAKSDRYLSSRAVWALSGARKAGFAVPNDTYNKGVKFLQSAYTASRQSDREGQAIILHGLAAAGAGDFAFANRLYRERNNLSPSGLLHVALTLASMDRKEMAKDLLDLVNLPVDRVAGAGPKGSPGSPGFRGFAPGVAPTPATDGVIPWMQSGVELRALYLLAIEAIQPTHEKAASLADWLMAARRGPRWTPEKANGPAIAALADWFSRTKHTNEKYTLSIFVNDRLVEKLNVDPAKDASRRIQVPQASLIAGKPQRINFDIEGRGRFSYSAVLGGFVPADKLKSTTNSWRVTRTYEPARRMLDGQVIPRGFGVLTGSYKTFQNKLTQLPLGERGEVTLRLYRSGIKGTKDEQLDYLVVVEPIPAGTMVLTESIKGNYERYEISPGAITFYIGDRKYPGNLQYTLVGYLPGDYRTVPTVVRSFYRPDRIAVAQPKALAVLARGEQSKDEYKLTPVELYEFGKRYLAQEQHAQSAEHLTPLFRDYRLKDKTYSEVVQMLFRSALAVVKNDAIVEYFEIIKEKYPQVEVDFASILKVAFAYRELGEYERSYLVYRATIEGSFQRESQIAGFLTARGEFLRSVQVLEGLLRDYPAESYVATATYALAQEVYGKGPEAAGDVKLREAKITRVDLIAASIGMLDHFISTWPRDPAADQASFSLATALLDLEQYENAITRCEKFAERYPDCPLLDSYWYFIGYSRFALGRPAEALEMCKKVAETTRKDPDTGIEIAAANKWQAIYIMGQIYHSLGKPAEAITEYERVKTRFSDAFEAIDFFTRKEIKLPEVTAIQPDDATSVKLKFRNVESANVKVYRIDLLKFGLMQRNLNRITAINLAGIRPYHELTLQLGDGKDFRDREQPLTLPLKDEGAYLVVCRGENLYTSGLVLVSPLVLEIQEDAKSGRVRVTVKDKTADKYSKDVQVKVIGSANAKFVSGETDLRGIFVADAIRGTSTVIARAGKDQYAFYRGKTSLGNVQSGAGKPREGRPGEGKKGKSAKPNASANGKDALLKNIRGQNGIFNRDQRANYRDLLNNPNKGSIKVDSAY